VRVLCFMHLLVFTCTLDQTQQPGSVNTAQLKEQLQSIQPGLEVLRGQCQHIQNTCGGKDGEGILVFVEGVKVLPP